MGNIPSFSKSLVRQILQGQRNLFVFCLLVCLFIFFFCLFSVAFHLYGSVVKLCKLCYHKPLFSVSFDSVFISFKVVPDTWTLIPWAHYMFLTLNVFMLISLYYANVRDPGFIPCNSPDYDMALKQVSTCHSIFVLTHQVCSGHTCDDLVI